MLRIKLSNLSVVGGARDEGPIMTLFGPSATSCMLLTLCPRPVLDLHS